MQQQTPFILFVATFIGFSIVFGGAPPAGAADTAAVKASYEQGVAAFNQEQFDVALEHFKEAYNLSEKPAILYNIAICEENLGNTDLAIAYYELYLEESPHADDARIVRQKVAHLKNPDEVPAPVTETADETETTNPPADAASTTTTAPTDSAAGPLLVYTPPDPNAHRYSVLQGLLIGGGSLFIVTGTLTGVSAYKKYNSYESVCAPNCTDAEVNKVKRLSIATDIQLGIGIAALASGIIWKIVYRKRIRERAVQPVSSLFAGPFFNSFASGLAVAGRF